MNGCSSLCGTSVFDYIFSQGFLIDLFVLLPAWLPISILAFSLFKWAAILTTGIVRRRLFLHNAYLPQFLGLHALNEILFRNGIRGIGWLRITFIIDFLIIWVYILSGKTIGEALSVGNSVSSIFVLAAIGLGILLMFHPFTKNILLSAIPSIVVMAFIMGFVIYVQYAATDQIKSEVFNRIMCCTGLRKFD